MADIDLNTSGIYSIYCDPSQRIYVGSAINIHKRWCDHRQKLNRGKHYNRKLQNAWNKHGADAFVFAAIEFVALDRLIEREQFHIDRLDATHKTSGFNICKNAGSRLDMGHTDETKAKLRASKTGIKYTEERIAKMRGRKASPEARANMSASRTGKKFSEERKARMSARQAGRIPTKAIEAAARMRRGRPLSDEHKAKVSASQIGKFVSEETRAKMAIAMTGRKITEASREKHRLFRHSEETKAKMRGREFTPEHRANLAKSSRGRKASPEARANMSAAGRGKTLTPEHRAKIGAAHRGKIQPPTTKETRSKLSLAGVEAWKHRKAAAQSKTRDIQGRLFE